MRVHVAAEEECLEALLGLVDHVVSERRLHQLGEPCVYLRSSSARAIVSSCIGDEGFALTLLSQFPTQKKLLSAVVYTLDRQEHDRNGLESATSQGSECH